MERPDKLESEKTDMYQKGTDRSSAVTRLENLIKSNNNQPIVIRSKDGEEAKLSKNSIQKLVSEDAIKKSVNNGFKREQETTIQTLRLCTGS